MNEINDVPVLLRGEIEARITASLIEAFADKLGHEKAVEIASNVILNLAVKSGADLAKRCGGAIRSSTWPTVWANGPLAVPSREM